MFHFATAPGFEANHTVANRHIIVRGVQEALRSVFGKEGEIYYEISHNLAQERLSFSSMFWATTR